MRLFEREAHIVREAAYQSFLEYRELWGIVAIHYMGSDEDVDCPRAHRAFNRAMNQKTLADFLDRESSYNFYTRYANEPNINTSTD